MESEEVAADFQALAIPDDTLGLHVLYEPKAPAKDIDVDVVAVHGIGGDSFSTWTDKSNGKLWLQEFLPQSPYFARARIMTFGYDARVFITPFEPSTTGRIFTFGEALLSSVNDSRPSRDARRRPVIFLAHSLGGLVVKSALVYAQARQTLYGDLYQSTKAIVFFGTPHDGADVAIWATYLGKISKAIGIRHAKVTAELQRWSDTLVELTTLFSEQAPDLAITTFFEKQAVHGVVVVPEGSARLGQRNEVSRGLDANHSTICKFATIDSSVYAAVKARLEATLIYIKEQQDQQAVLLSTSVPQATQANESNDQEFAARMQALQRDG